ncbi:MAG: hypothetical protein Kow0065_22150 [Methylomicrobium sp.]
MFSDWRVPIVGANSFAPCILNKEVIPDTLSVLAGAQAVMSSLFKTSSRCLQAMGLVSTLSTPKPIAISR